ncbi:MAG TPA: outer membrane lipoprotein carrier protein LolA [Myxococcota bacterium]|nr:outer membrane lipoprotein carrier protein LolA [Myxococcota bacterium]
MALHLRSLVASAMTALQLAAAPVVLLAAVSPSPALAQDAAAELIKQVEAKYKGITSMKAQVTQTTRSELFGTETIRGELVLKRPAMMRWAFGDQKLFITNGQKMWIYTAEDHQVIEYDDIASGRATAESLLTSLDKLTSMFDIKVLATSAYGHVLELKPHNAAQFKKIQLTLDKDLMVTSVVITDTFDNQTDLAFAAVQLNVPADDSLFTYKAPAGVSVVKAPTN